MQQRLETGKLIQPLTNVAALAQVVETLENRPVGAHRLGVFYGPNGYGKTYAASFCATNFGAIHIAVKRSWTLKHFLKRLMGELGLPVKGQIADMIDTITDELLNSPRTIIVDEVDYLVGGAKGCKQPYIQDIRDIQDGSGCPFVLIGMEELPQKLNKWPEIRSRILPWTPAAPADLKDVKMLAEIYATGITVSDDLLKVILEKNTGSPRRCVNDLSQVVSEAQALGLDTMGVKEWGGIEFEKLEAPQPRNGMKI